jgi:phosphoglycolate phosphatase-like HAD superfamily hydrolase
MSARPVYPRLPLREQTELLRGIVDRCARLAREPKQSAPRPLVVFDLDGTLMDNRPRTCVILHQIAERWRSEEPALASRLAAVTPNDLHYHFKQSLALLGVTRADLADEAFAFWKLRFFSDESLRHDIEVPGAAAFVRACYESGASVLYLTGRDLPLMGMGTFASLRDLGFPIGVCGSELVLKPDPAMPDAAFKRAEAPELGRVGQVVAAFDNEPENCNVIAGEYPEATSVLIDTQHMGNAPPLQEAVKVIGDFRM